MQTEFEFGTTTVTLLRGDILSPGVEVQAVGSSDDNYLTMAGGVSRLLAARAGPEYVRDAQAHCPVPAGSVVVTGAYNLPEHGLDVQYVLHGAVVDYDTEDRPLEELVYQVTHRSLEQAGDLGVQRVLLPAFGTGAGGLSMGDCARQMSTAIKAYLADARPITHIYVILYLPEPGTEAYEEWQQYCDEFTREANLVLGVPYTPLRYTRQMRDFYGREQYIRRITDVLSDQQHGKRHVVILGGPEIGKTALLDHLYLLGQQPDHELSSGRRVVKVGFGHVHEYTALSFIYRKFLYALGNTESDPEMQAEIKALYAEPDLNCDRVLDFLDLHEDRYPQVVFLIDHLPKLIRLEADTEIRAFTDARAFWADIDRLQDRVRFVYSARDNEQYEALLTRLSDEFQAGVDVIRLRCLTEEERETWIDAVYDRYLGRPATRYEHNFFEEEAGWHPYLLSLTCHALIEAIKRDALTSPTHPDTYDRQTLAPFMREARRTIAEARREFFATLMTTLRNEERVDLFSLARAVALEEEKALLAPSARAGDPEAVERLQALYAEVNPRQYLHTDVLARLETHGYVVNAGSIETAAFMARSFATYVADFFDVHGRDSDEPSQPRNVVISFLSEEPEGIRTMFRARGARIVSDRKRVRPDSRTAFVDGFNRHIERRLSPAGDIDEDDDDVFRDTEEIGTYILTQFTTMAVKRYLHNLPEGSTISLVVDDALQDIPWELMLETAYAAKIPFRVGRSVVGGPAPDRIKPVVRGNGKIGALLVGDPTDDLEDARIEVEQLRRRFKADGRFEVTALIGASECKRIRLLNHLSSGSFALIHYSGHTRFDGDQSVWQVADGVITTDMLTNALQTAPPAFVFSASCESAAGGEPGTARYEGQTFDLPSAFLHAGVDAYVGTLWKVDTVSARMVSEEFYTEFLTGEQSVGECLRRAKWAGKQREEPEQLINWLAFTLYGNPDVLPGDLFPIMNV